LGNDLATQYYHTIKDLEQQIGDVRRQNTLLRKRIEEQDRTITAQQERIAELEEENRKLRGKGKRLKDIIFKKSVKKSKGKTQKRGAKKGHKASVRRKPKEEEVTQEKEVRLAQCPHCSTSFEGQSPRSWTERTVTDVPLPVEPIITRYHLARYHCPCCDKWVQGIPKGTLPYSPFGINIMLLVLTMKYRGKATDDHIREHLQTCYRLPVGKGTIHSLLNRAAELFGPAYEGIKQAIREGKVVQADETGWRVEGGNWHAWAFLNDDAVFFTIENTRGKGIPERELKDFDGCLVSDGLQSYNVVEGEHQLCIVHLLRHTHHHATVDKATKEAVWFHEQMTWFFRVARKRHKRCRSPGERTSLHSRMLRSLERYWKDVSYEDSAIEKTRKWWLEDRGAKLLTFLQYENVPWHNNAAERALRPLVTRRKVCGGSRSQRGAEREAINMSCIMTILKQEKSPFEEIPQILNTALKWA
jgi:transposase